MTAFVWTIIYGVQTASAVGLSLRKDGPIAVVGVIIGTFWCWQTILYFVEPPRVTNIVGMMFDATLLIVLAVIWMRERVLWPILIGVALAAQICLHVAYRQEIVPTGIFRLAVNALYVTGLAVLAWPERKP